MLTTCFIICPAKSYTAKTILWIVTSSVHIHVQCRQAIIGNKVWILPKKRKKKGTNSPDLPHIIRAVSSLSGIFSVTGEHWQRIQGRVEKKSQKAVAKRRMASVHAKRDGKCPPPASPTAVPAQINPDQIISRFWSL